MTPTSLILDSHIIVWALNGQQLTKRTKVALGLADRLYCSAASVWELMIKSKDGGIELPKGWVDSVADTGIDLLDVTCAHALAIKAVELPHADPFDRLLVAQAMSEGFGLLTADQTLLKTPYPFIVKA
jgi:PIN domain nuclease of toxin-antitoxin system